MFGELVIGEFWVGKIPAGEIAFGKLGLEKLRWGNYITPLYLYPKAILGIYA